MPNKKSILLVDDEAFFRERLAKAIANRGFFVFEGEDYFSAIEIISRHRPDYAVFDLKIPHKTGLALLKDGLDIHPEMAAVMLSGYGSIASATEAMRLGALNYLSKPVDVDDILNAFSSVLKNFYRESILSDSPPSLERTEIEHINRVLQDCKGNISQTAKKLGIHRRTLQRKLQKIN